LGVDPDSQDCEFMFREYKGKNPDVIKMKINFRKESCDD
jgi:hypothetical protein